MLLTGAVSLRKLPNKKLKQLNPFLNSLAEEIAARGDLFIFSLGSFSAS